MTNWTLHPIDRLLALAVVLALAAALATRGRGGRFRLLLGWAGFWALFAGLLAGLVKLPAVISLVLLGVVMYAGLRTWFFVTPLRPRDRFAILGAYLAIPAALAPGYAGAHGAVLAAVPILLLLTFPVLLIAGPAEEGTLDALGRLLLGVLVFVFCAAHLGLLVRREQLELYGVLGLAADLPQRLAGRFEPGSRLRPAAGIVVSALLASGLGGWSGPWCGVSTRDGAIAGMLVAVAVAMGAAVIRAVLRDLGLSSQTLHGRGAFLDRVVPLIYAAPFFYYSLVDFT
jgi:predicted CDP-diglyceride synthetase/phosphatidate cytidylyltransferase